MEASPAQEILMKFTGFSLIVVEINVVLWVFSIFAPGFVETLNLTPVFVMRFFEPWRFLTSPFVVRHFLEVLVILPAYCSTASISEKRQGSLKYCLYFFSNCVVLQMVCVLITWILRFDEKRQLSVLFAEILVEVFVSSRKNLDSPVNFLCFPGKIKSEYYPYALSAIGLFLGLYSEVISGILIGFLSTF
jgi:membrane associated rhomboid family serine protease